MQKNNLDETNVLVNLVKTKTNRATVILLLFLLIVIPAFVNIFLLKSKKFNKEEQLSEMTKQLESLSEGVAEKQTTDQEKLNNESDKYKYLLQEYNLLTESKEHAESLLFGFKFNQFHKDWECLNSGLQYTASGITLTCRQKPCSLIEGAKFPNVIMVEKSQACVDELKDREFPGNVLSSFDINISPFYVKHDQEFADVEDFSHNRITSKGYSYQFNVIQSNNKRETGYIKQYEVVFYSPKTVSDLMSNYSGTYFGREDLYAKYHEDIYAKYHIVVDVYEAIEPNKELAEEKFLQLIGEMIDAIRFLS